MTHTPFTDSVPINDNTGLGLVDITEKNLQALRDALNMGHLPGWDYTPGNGVSGDDWHREVIRWNKPNAVTGVTEQVRVNTLWNMTGSEYENVKSVEHQWRPDTSSIWYSYGLETMTWDADGNLISTTWGGTPTLLDFEDGKPVNSDPALQTVDYIRENLMALRDCVVVGAMNGWEYDTWVGNGSAEERQYIQWEKGSGPERLLATLTWSSGRVDTEQWAWRPNPATGQTIIGTKTYTYDADSNVISAVWSGTPTYVGFADDKPVDSDTGNTVLTDIKNNLQGLRDGILYGGMDFWDYSKTDGSGTAEMPQYYYLKKGTDWIRATNTWGTSGGEEHNIAAQIWDYSSNSGGVYDLIGTLSFTYTADGAPSATTWS